MGGSPLNRPPPPHLITNGRPPPRNPERASRERRRGCSTRPPCYLRSSCLAAPTLQGIRRRAGSRGSGRAGPLAVCRMVHELERALIVNPYDARDIGEAVDQALRMPLAERRERCST